MGTKELRKLALPRGDVKEIVVAAFVHNLFRCRSRSVGGSPWVWFRLFEPERLKLTMAVCKGKG